MRNFTFLLFFVALFFACESENVTPKDEKEDKEEPQPQPVEAKIKFSDLNFSGSYVATGSTLYPSLVLAQAAYEAKSGEEIPHMLLELTAPRYETTELEIKLGTSDYTNSSTERGSIANKDRYQIWPDLSWNYSELKKATRAGVFNIPITVSLHNEELGHENIDIPYRSVHECPFFFNEGNTATKNLAWMFAAYVDEEHPYLDEFLGNVLQNTDVVDSFDGYSSDDIGVINQVFAIWKYMQDQGVKYSSITTTSNESDRVVSQYIRPIPDVIDNSQANCADGSVFLASVLRKIGIEPFLVLVPGHMFIGYYTNSEKSEFMLLETTMVGLIDIREITINNYAEYRAYVSPDAFNFYEQNLITFNEYVKQVSKGTFNLASNNKVQFWNDNVPKFNDSDDWMHQILDIAALREFVQPLGLE